MNSIKALLRDTLAESALLSGLSDPGKRARGKLTVVTFHRVLPEQLRQQYPYPGICVTPEELRWFCSFFQKYFTIGPLTHLHERWLQGEPTDRPLLAITFDDGQLDNLQYGLPVLDEFGYQATFYIPVAGVDQATILWHDRMGYCALAARNQGENAMQKTLGLAGKYGIPTSLSASFENHLVEHAKRIPSDKRLELVAAIEEMLKSQPPEWGRLMTWDEIRAMHTQGHEIGSHSMTHTLMPQCNDNELHYEMTASRKRLEAELSSEIHSFCYPNGDFDARSVAAAREAGYRNAVTTRWGKNEHEANPYELRRCDINPFNNWNRRRELSAARFALRLSGLQPGLRAY